MAKTKLTLTLTLLTTIILTVSAVAAAGYLMQAPNSPVVTVNPTPTPTPAPQATMSAVTVDKTTLYVGESLTLTTTVSDHTAGLTVTFRAVTGGADVGTAVTDSDGTATLTFTPSISTTRYYAIALHP